MNKTLEKFYTSLLKLMGCEYINNVIHWEGNPVTLNDKKISLPYEEILRRPMGKTFMHPLHENFLKPESDMYKLIKKHILFNINLKLIEVFLKLIEIGSDPSQQQQVRDVELAQLLTELGETSIDQIDIIPKLVKKIKNTDGSIFVGIFTKRNAKVNGTAYGAVGELDFAVYKAACAALTDGAPYKLHGVTLRKQDLKMLVQLHLVTFPNTDDASEWRDVTDNKVFRQLDILLRSAFMLVNRLNKIIKLLKDSGMGEDLVLFDTEVFDTLPELYEMTPVIRMIPNQDEDKPSNTLGVSAGSSVNAPPEQPHTPPPPPPINQPGAPVVIQQPSSGSKLLDMWRNNVDPNPPQYPQQPPYGYQQPYAPPQYQHPGLTQQQMHMGLVQQPPPPNQLYYPPQPQQSYQSPFGYQQPQVVQQQPYVSPFQPQPQPQQPYGYQQPMAQDQPVYQIVYS